MQSWYAQSFEREMGCTAGELLAWLDGACGGRPVSLGEHRASVQIDAGHLCLQWQALPARQIALMRMPRLAVSFRFEHVEEAMRQKFMRYFDLYTQRGGG